MFLKKDYLISTVSELCFLDSNVERERERETIIAFLLVTLQVPHGIEMHLTPSPYFSRASSERQNKSAKMLTTVKNESAEIEKGLWGDPA